MTEVISLPLDVVIVGAGPCGLAVASRLAEATPSALFTDAEHERFWGKRHSSSHRKTLTRSQDLTRQSPSTSRPVIRYNMTVLESHSNQWMSRWNSRFDALRISHLRSPMFFHVDPGDRDGLLAYAYAERREKELKEVRNVVGKELSKHHRKQRRSAGKKAAAPKIVPVNERDREDYFRPSQKLFCDHCQYISRRYGVENLIQQAQVTSVSYDQAEDDSGESLFTIESSTGKLYARAVVMAIGPGAPQCAPTTFEGNAITSCHTSYIMDGGDLPDHLMKKIKTKAATNVVVVGGGLTSAQITDLLIKKGVTKVWHLMRGPTKVRHFDLELPWVGKYKNNQLSTFWCCDDDDERLKMILESRNGGTLTPEHRTILENHCAHGRASLSNYTEIASKTWDPSTNTWLVTTKSTQAKSKMVDEDDAVTANNSTESDLTAENASEATKPGAASPSHVTIDNSALNQHPMKDADAESSTSCTVTGAIESTDTPSSTSHPTTPMSKPPASNETTLPPIDLIIFSTGSVADVNTMPLLQPLHHSHPIDTKGGLPCLTNDLMWRDDVPLFFAGKLAGLRLGPFAANLEGARQGAERIAWKIEEMLLPEDTVDGAPVAPDERTDTITTGSQSQMSKSRKNHADKAKGMKKMKKPNDARESNNAFAALASNDIDIDMDTNITSISPSSSSSSSVSSSISADHASSTDHTDVEDEHNHESLDATLQLDSKEDTMTKVKHTGRNHDASSESISMNTKASWYTRGVGSMYLALEEEC